MRNAAKGGAQHHLGIAVIGLGEVSLERALVGELAGDVEARDLGERQVGGRVFKVRILFCRNGQRLLVAQGCGDDAHGRDFLGGIHPEHFAVERHEGDDVVELSRRGCGRIGFAAAGDEYRPGFDAFGLQHGGQQRVFVFAIAILVGEYVVSRVRLVAADAEFERDIVDMQRDIVEEGPDFVFVRCEAFGEAVGPGLDGRGDGERALLERVVPCTHLLPAGEGSDLHRGLPLLDGFWRRIGIGTRQVGTGPVAELASVGKRGGGLEVGAGHGDLFAGGEIEVQLLVEDDEIFLECVFQPEVARHIGLDGAYGGLVFEGVANAQAAHGHVFLVDVGVHGRFAGYVSGQILNVVFGA